MKLIISYSVFHKPYRTIPVILRAHNLLFPSFDFYLHHDGCLDNYYYSPVLEKLENEGLVKIIKVDKPVALCRSMLWRMLPIWENTDYVFCRDLDSLPMPKERLAMEEFISSGKIVHGINDNDQHSIPMMGGMVGFKSKEFESLTKINSWEKMISICNWEDNKWNNKGSDQEFMNTYLWPIVKQNSLIHKFEGNYYEDTTNKKDLSMSVTDVDEKVMAEAGKFSNYIGASCQNEYYKNIIQYYKEKANNKIKLIEKVEDSFNISQNNNFKDILQYKDST